MPRRSNNDIADWGRTVKDTLSQLGQKQRPSTPKIKVPKYSSIGLGSQARNKSRIASSNKRRNQATARRRRVGTQNRNIR